MAAFAELDIEARTDQLVKARAELDKLTSSAARTEDAAKDAGVAVSSASGSMGMAGGNARMLSQQLSQVAQQGAATGQWAQAFAIQAADIGLAFGAVGTILGALATVALPTFLASLSGTTTGASELSNAMSLLDEQIANTGDLADIAAGNFDSLIERFGALTPAVLRFVDAEADISMRRLAEAANNLTTELTAMYNGNGWLNVSRVEDLQTAFGLAGDETRALASLMVSLRDAATLDDQVEIATLLRERFVSMAGPVAEMTRRQFEFYAQIVDTEAALSATKSRVDDVERAAQSAAQAASPIAGFIRNVDTAADAAAASVSAIGDAASAAAGEVSNLAQSMWDASQARIAANRAVTEMQTEFSEGGQAMLKYGGRGASSDASALAKTHDMTGAIIPPKVAGASRRGGGGGGAAASDGFEDRLSALTEQFATEQQLADQWYEESQAVLSDRRALELLGKEEHAEMLLSVENEYQSKLAEIKSKGHEAERQMMSQTIDATVGLLQQFGAKSKGLAIAALAVNAARRVMEIRANTAAAVMRAYAELGPIAGSAAAAKIKVMGAVQTGIALASATLGAASGGGGGGGGSITEGSRAATPAPEQQQRIVRLDVRGEGMFADMLRESGSAIVDALTNESKFGGTTVIMGR